MFIENLTQPGQNTGWIEIITGPMFSGKTEELIRRIRRAQIAKQEVGIYKPAMENRYATDKIVSHNKKEEQSIGVNSSAEIIDLSKSNRVVAIDEAQFFDNDLAMVVSLLANSGKRVIIAGLDMDYLGKPFGVMPQLMAIAEYITKLHSICMDCGNPAIFSYRLIQTQNQLVELGAQDKYTPLCRPCYQKKMNR